MSSPTRPAVRRLASVLAATALLTGGIVAGAGTAAASLPVTDDCEGQYYPCHGPQGSAEIALREATTAILNPVLVPLLSAYKSVFNNTGSLAE
ncbi:hypothetical protein [Rhodococcus tukisamuensis]|uniref:Uncharacterized protein n=1 Tax=Rhodococcus tukisamuensis TaxID=168276 RepID=A0A1G6YI95_9NOCA|nr:hypothetical protein [Rhodococcus tukisamuensis]SDD89991.1 hypothetical protein SAMN05444580_107190 [Rhodococcus tukisamuensis]